MMSDSNTTATPSSSTATSSLHKILISDDVIWTKSIMTLLVCLGLFVGTLHVFTTGQKEGSAPSLLDGCYSDRYDRYNGKNTDGNILFQLLELSVMLTVGLVVWQGRTARHALMLVSIAGAWYYTTAVLVTALKHILDDTQCSRRPNSVSGHAAFYAFMPAALAFIYGRIKNQSSVPLDGVSRKGQIYWHRSNTMFVAMELITILLTLINGYHTYTHGFHSPRQITYGIVLGLLALLAFITTLPCSGSYPSSYRESIVAVFIYGMLTSVLALPVLRFVLHRAGVLVLAAVSCGIVSTLLDWTGSAEAHDKKR
eukprot:gb/GECH01012652.1/.p1 GENE.gb/GECH01012652.1/~~gb/GECH01012652.1/.p1  ORF type:complete len:312 (+),score=16.14 gb/GECH01012652.1/:1-936(+)